MPLSINSPRVDFRTGDFTEVDNALSTIGHVVLDNVWNKNYLSEVYLRSKQRYEKDDARYSGHFDKYHKVAIDSYLGGHLDFEQLRHESVSNYLKDIEKEFFIEYQRAGLVPLMQLLFSGSFMLGRSERVVRRADPKFPARFTGLHTDGQLNACSQKGIHSKRELTLWTPLNSVEDDSKPRLLLLDKKETSFLDIFNPEELIENFGVKYLPIQLKPFQIKNETAYWEKNSDDVKNFYSRLFANKECYAPYLPLGSSILFSKEVIHGTYILNTMEEARYSFDVRMVGEYKVDGSNAQYSGYLFTTGHNLPKATRTLTNFFTKKDYAIVRIKRLIKKILGRQY
jgi:hypothetical protein